MRVEAGRARKIRLVLDDDEGFAKDTSGDVHATVARPDGTEVLASTAAVSAGKGAYDLALPAQTQLDELAVTWTVTGSLARTVTTSVTVVGQRLLSLERLRQDPELEETRASVLLRILESVETRFGEILHFPTVPSPARIRRVAPRSGVLSIGDLDIFQPLEFYAGTQGDVALTVGDLRGIFGGVEFSDGRLWTFGQQVDLWFSHGFLWTPDGRPPSDLVDAGAVYARYLARTSKTSERAIRVSTEGQDILLGTANADRPTGLPDVDSVLNAYKVNAVV